MRIEKVSIIIVLFFLLIAGYVRATPTLVFPKNHQSVSDSAFTIVWDVDPTAVSYDLQVSTTATFTTTAINVTGLTVDTFAVKNLAYGSYYYWRVQSHYAGGATAFSLVDTFGYFDANSFPGLTLWLRADGNVVLDGFGNVSGWVNEAPNTTDTLAQTVQTKRPSVVKNAFCNRTMLYFSGNTAGQDLKAPSGFQNIGSNSESMFVIGQALGASPYTYFCKSILTGAANRYALYNYSNSISFALQDGGALGTAVASTGYTANFLTTFENIINRTKGADTLFLDDLFLPPTAATKNVDPVSYNYTSVYPFYVGAYQNSTNTAEQPGWYLNGYIGDIVFYDSAFNTAQRQQVSQYLMDKYAPPVNLGPNKILNNFCADTIRPTTGCFTTYQWYVNGNKVTADTLSYIVATAPGTYVLVASDVFFRNSIDTILVIEPNPNFTGANSKICFGDTVVWNTGLDSTKFTFLWSNGTTRSYLNIATPGTYSVTVTGPGGCKLASNAVTFTVDSFALETSLGSNDSVCSGNLLSLVSGAYLVSHYQWSTSATDTLPSISLSNSGTYKVTLTDAFGCVSVDSIHIFIKGVGPVSNFKADTVCLGAPTQFTDLSTVPSPTFITAWKWSFGDSTSPNTQQNPAHIYPAAGIYNATLTTIANTGCISTPITLPVLVRPTAKAFFTDSLACTGDTTRFFDASTAAPGDSLITWFWNFGSGSSSTLENSKHKFNSTGTDTVSLAVSTVLGCYDTFSRSISVINSFAAPDTFALLSPINNTNLSDVVDTFTWQASTNAVRYVLQVSSSPNFHPLIFSHEVYTPHDSTSTIPISYNIYYWRVLAFNICGDTFITPIDSFTRFTPAFYKGSGFNPSFWVMANGLMKQTQVGNKVIEWIDQSGNGNNVFQPDSVNTAPKWLPNSQPTLNNRPVVFFNGQDTMTGGNILNLHTHSRTSFVIGKSISNTGTYFGKTYYGKTTGSRYALAWVSGILTYFYQDTLANFSDTISRDTYGSYEMIADIIDRNSSTVSLIRNSEPYSPLPPVAPANYDITSSFNFLLGGYGWGNASPNEATNWLLNGDIAEIIFFDTTLSTQDYDAVRRYLYIKYGGGPVYLGPDIHIKYGFCSTVTLDASNRYVKYQWSTGDTTQTIATKLPGAYSVTVTDIFEQQWSDTINIIRPGIQLPGDTIFCLGDSILLNVDLGSSYHYIFGTGDSTINTTPRLTVNTPGKYWITISDTVSPLQGGPCFISDTINVRVDSFRVTATLGPDTTLCRGQYIGLQTDAAIAQSYQWSDGSSGDTLVIDSSGTYKVTVTSVNGCVAYSSIHVNASGAVANVGFSILPAYCIGDTVCFHNQSTIISPFKIVGYQWLFGTGGGDTVASPCYYYADTGSYNVTLTVIADSGCIKSITEPLSIFPLPSDSFTYGIGCADAPMNFYNRSTSIFADAIDSSVWFFGDNTSDTVLNARHAYAEPGLYAVDLMVTTHTGCKQSFVDTVQVFPQLKVAIAADHLCEGQAVQFHDASPGFSNVAWIWNFPDNTTAVDSNPTKSFNPTGQYVISLIVTNAIGCVSADTDTITIYNPPVANFNNPDGCVQLPYQLSDLSIFTQGDSLQSQVWNFGDSSAISYKHRPQHLFPDSGIYNVTLTVTTQHGCQDSITLPVDLLGPPRAAFTFSPNFGGAPININFSNQSVGGVSYYWDFGDGDNSNNANPSHTYAQNGTYVIHLIAYNQVGCSDTATDSVKVVPASLDLAILFTDVNHDTSGRYDLDAFIINVGTRTVYYFDIVASLGGASTIIEHVNDTLVTGDTLTYHFVSHYFTSVPDNQTYICIQTENPDSGIDQNPANNIICTALQDDIRIISPYPNPAKDEITFGAVLPSNEPVTITLYDELGKKSGTVFSGTGLKGLNQWSVNTGTLAEGSYYFLVQYKQEYFTVKFIIQR